MKILKNFIKWCGKWKVVDTSKYEIELPGTRERFELTPAQKARADQIYKDKGTIEYTFYPCGGIGWGCKVKVWSTGEYIDITDVSNW